MHLCENLFHRNFVVSILKSFDQNCENIAEFAFLQQVQQSVSRIFLTNTIM